MSIRSDEDLTCPVCQDLFSDPVVLDCSHSFCKDCLQRWWNQKTSRECPCCKVESKTNNPPCNLALKNLSEAFLLERNRSGCAGSDTLCSEHGEKLKLFCLDHQQPICLVCRDSRAHANHTFLPVNEAACDHREKLQKCLKPLQEKLKAFEQMKETCDQTAQHIKVQAKRTETLIREQFQKFHQFLEEEEEARVSALREEERRKSALMGEKLEALSRDMSALSNTVRATEGELRADDASFLKNYKNVLKRAEQRSLLDAPPLSSGALIDAAKHLGNLSFHIWNKMKAMVSYTPVVLDPNTADAELVLCKELTSVRFGAKQNRPNNPERSRFLCSVLGSEGFTSGNHTWDIEVGENKDWELGVLGDVTRNRSSSESRLWRIMFSNSKLLVFSTSDPERVLPLKKRLRKIRVNLNLEEGDLSFYDLDKNTHIYTFKDTFTDTLFPYIYTENHLPINILPEKFSVRMEKQSYVGV
ncbi:E3 ubiquitin-protein ligase TRIM35-like [Betta splendens]|uniref:E3 ubiquitin-protein ligase TRIM35-like n=1 Tax=Betta splendens TaxID=158456 RepID=A0A6P7MKA6_BETSP|nr:E3 ubiquitin-protein ligase TRIM35-like [Betta splendens]